MKRDANVDKGARLILVGPFPPPMHGMSSVNLAVYQKLKDRDVVPLVIDTSPGSLERGILSRLSRLPRVLHGLGRMLIRFSRVNRGVVYLSVSGGAGQVYEALFVLAARVFGWRSVLHHHSYAYIDNPRWYTRYFIGLAGTNAIHVVLCDEMGKQLESIYGGVCNTRILSNISFLSELYVSNSRRKKRLNKIGFLSNISESKGVLDFLSVAEQLEKQSSDIEVLLAGPFQDKKIEGEVRERLSTLRNVRYLGPVYGSDKKRFFDSIDVLLFPTKFFNEAEPLTLYEAVCSGVPVIARGRGCISSMVDRAFGLVINKHDDYVSPAVRQIVNWIKAPDEYSSASNAAIRYAKERREVHLAQLEELCKVLTRGE